MDIYFIVAELDLPQDALVGWLECSVASRNARGRGENKTSVAMLLDGAEGDVRVTAEGDHFSLRAALVDAAYFAVTEGLQAGFEAAAKLGARGAWYAGDHTSGRFATLGSSVVSAKVAKLPEEVRLWVTEAGELLSQPSHVPKAVSKKAVSKKAVSKKR